MRVAAYVGVSVALAASVVMRAAYERPNFYSACVYLSQSNACLMILTNLVLLCTASLMYGLQRLLYGPLRPMEIERLYEHAWFAVTETLLAMTIFRDDVGVWFFVMFVSLIAGKIWQWIGAGRVEFVEQQPPTSNEFFFHSRLASSLLLSIIYDMVMLGYCVDTVRRQARPNMIVMFGFEYALLLVASFATFFRHILVLTDLAISAKQTELKRQEMLEERRAEVRRQREADAAAQSGEVAPTDQAAAEAEVEVDDNEIDVPGWEGKGRWIFYSDLATDFVKLTIYMAFFVILMAFHGLPIHIMRDVLLTFRSFHRRIYDFLRYRNATRDMHIRYPDATQEDLGDNNICIICREEMRPWAQPEQPPTTEDGARPPPPLPRIDERHRAKKLPCGHCLHISCLRSWLERQQACPTCRQPVLVEENHRRQQQNRVNPPVAGAQPDQPGDPNAPGNDPNGLQIPGAPRIRHFQFGPIRIGYGVRQNIIPPNPQPGAAPAIPPIPPVPAPTAEPIRQRTSHRDRGNREARHLLREALARPLREGSVLAQTMWLDQLERRLMDEIQALNVAQSQLYVVRALQAEYMRLRNLQTTLANERNGRDGLGAGLAGLGGGAQPANSQLPNLFGGMNVGGLNSTAPRGFQPASGPQHPFLGTGDANLPEGLTLPPDWTLLPLQRAPDSRNGHRPSESLSQILGPGSRATSFSTLGSPRAERQPPPVPDDSVAALQVWDETMRRTLRNAQDRSFASLGSSAPTPVPPPSQPDDASGSASASTAARPSTPSAPTGPRASGPTNGLFRHSATGSMGRPSSSSLAQAQTPAAQAQPISPMTTTVPAPSSSTDAAASTGLNTATAPLPNFAAASAGSSLLDRLGLATPDTSTPASMSASTDTVSTSASTGEQQPPAASALDNPFADPVDVDGGEERVGAAAEEAAGIMAATGPPRSEGAVEAGNSSSIAGGSGGGDSGTGGDGEKRLQPSVEEGEDDGT